MARGLCFLIALSIALPGFVATGGNTSEAAPISLALNV